ncbi:MAG: PIN domain-containing protein [Bifidobacteriaceae bacterium]|nr:PIN domain-containing protein [Bifidobacteriaceae bacterium]
MSSAQRGLLDTSALIGLGELDPADLPEVCLVAAVTLAELSAAPLITDDIGQRGARQALLQQVERDFDIAPFDADCARALGQVSADLRRAGRKTSARAIDALIAATALALGVPLYTRNPDGFEHIGRLAVVPLPPHP